MTRVLVRSGKDPFTMVSAESTFQQDVYNTNVGNYLFAHSMFRALSVPGSDLVSNSTLSETRPATAKSARRVSDEFDVFVVPLANAFRPEFARRLENLTTLVERLDIPVVVAGVGVQTGPDLDLGALEHIAPLVRRFVRAVLDRSASIGVRGEVTARFLHGLGFGSDVVDVIGCPSAFLRGPHFRAPAAPGALVPTSTVALSLTEGVPGLGAFVTQAAARHPGLVYVGQDKDDLRMMLWGEAPPRETDPALPLHPDHPLVREDRVRFPVETWSWLTYLAGFDYAVGTRLHGCVAALLAGTPATLLAHDSRTLELAEYHGLPHRHLADGVPTGLGLEELAAEVDPAPFDRAYPPGFARFTDFLERNALAHAYATPEGTVEFDARVSTLDLPPPLRPLTSGPEQVHGRLRWLRDGLAFDSTAHPDAYRHPFPHPRPPDQRTPAKRAARALGEQVAGLEESVTTGTSVVGRQDRRLKRLRERLDRQSTVVAAQAEAIARLEERLDRTPTERLRRRLRGPSSDPTGSD